MPNGVPYFNITIKGELIMAITTRIDLDEYTTNNIEAYFKALYVLQRTPGCEKESEILQVKLESEFEDIPEKITQHLAYKQHANFRYHTNGKLELVSNAQGDYHIMIKPYKSTLLLAHLNKVAEKEAKSKKNKNKTRKQSYIYLKRVNHIWYAQVMNYIKRTYSIVQKDKIHYDEMIQKYNAYKSLSENDKQSIDDVTINDINRALESEVRKLMRLFKLDLQPVKLYSANPNYGIKNQPNHIDNKHFFYLSDIECKLIIKAIDKDQIDARKVSYNTETKALTYTLREIIMDKDNKRVYVEQPASEDMYIPDMNQEGWRRNIFQAEYITGYILDQVKETPKPLKSILKRFNVEPEEQLA